MEWNNRTHLLIGEENVGILSRAHVAICGMGAVGSFAVEALARAGVGHLRLVDYDHVHPSNINRQLFALTSTQGMKKTEVARIRVKDINPLCHVEILDTYIDETTNPRIMEGQVDVMIDAIDSLTPKIFLIANAFRAGIPVISSMGAAGRMDANAITTGDLSETHTCPLARFVRRRLHRQGIFSGIRCIFSTEMPMKKKKEDKEPHDGKRQAPVLGSISYVTAIYGLKAAYEAIDCLLKQKGGCP
ncbi:MAG: tRNA threonylcarbamoyladenosine dehydratase [Proteobacteria bacterium]|nr:tRNA threonylcarbamoyladenosine dehydratase [Pseudomonadota bacterium]